jgi:hypothetical protein
VVWLGQQVYVGVHPAAVSIGSDCTIGMRASMFSHFYSGPKRSSEHAAPVEIEDDARSAKIFSRGSAQWRAGGPSGWQSHCGHDATDPGRRRLSSAGEHLSWDRWYSR